MNIILKVLFKGRDESIPIVVGKINMYMEAPNLEIAKDILYSNLEYIKNICSFNVKDDAAEEILNLLPDASSAMLLLTDVTLKTRNTINDELTLTYESPYAYIGSIEEFILDDENNFDIEINSMKIIGKLLQEFMSKEDSITAFTVEKNIEISYNSLESNRKSSYIPSANIIARAKEVKEC